jgi:hypothetical protein
VIYALRHPALLLGLVLGFLIGVVLRVSLQRTLAGARAGRRLRTVGPRPGGLTPRGGWGTYLDPYGTVAAVISGAGWAARPPARRGARGDVLALVGALLAHAALAAIGFVGFAAAGGHLAALDGIDVSDLLHGSLTPTQSGQAIALGFAAVNLACALLALFPVPPLELGVVLWSRLPRSASARRMAYHLLEEQWGVALILLLLLLPLGGEPPLLLVLINAAAAPILSAL